MKNILHIITSPRGSESVSIQLGNAIVTQLTQTFPGSNVTTLNLATNPLPHLDEVTITALRTPADHHTTIQKQALKASDAAIAQLFDADILVIGVPLYNFGVPSNLKSWLDHIYVRVKHLAILPKAQKGLWKAKKCIWHSARAQYMQMGPIKILTLPRPM